MTPGTNTMVKPKKARERKGKPESLNLNDLKAQYEEKVPVFKRLEQEALFILGAALKEQNIRVHLISSRVKDVESFIDKVKRKEYCKPFEELEDAVGLRVVCLFLSDIPRIGDIIRDSFEVLSEDNRIEDYDVASFGYLSVHFVAKMKREFKGPRYDQLTGIPFETQIRTIAMHAWATISHYLEYKHPMDVPAQLRRDFYALSGLFYVADTHFEMFFNSSQESRQRVMGLYDKPISTIDEEINLDSLRAYLYKKFPARIHGDSDIVSELVGELSDAGYKTIAQLDGVLEAASAAFAAYEKSHQPAEEPRYRDVGVVRSSLRIADDKYLDLLRRQYLNFPTERYTKLRHLLKQPHK